MFICDRDIEILPKETMKKNIVEKLKNENLLEYGITIKINEIERLYEIKKDDMSEKDWQFTVLNLMQILRDQNFFTTTRDRNGALYILKRNEMSKYNANQNKLSYDNLKSRQRSLYSIQTHLLSHEENKKLEFEIMQNGHLQLEMARKLKERCRY